MAKGKTKAAPENNASEHIDKTQATETFQQIAESTESTGLELKIGKTHRISHEGRALIRLIGRTTTLSHRQIAQLLDISSSSTITKIIENDYFSRGQNQDQLEIDPGFLQAFCTRIDRFSAWVQKYGKVRIQGGQEPRFESHNRQTNVPDGEDGHQSRTRSQAKPQSSKSSHQRPEVLSKASKNNKRKAGERDNDDEVDAQGTVKRRRTTDIDKLQAIFDAIGYRPKAPAELLDSGFGPEELKTILDVSKENALKTLKLFSPFKQSANDSKSALFYKQLMSEKKKVRNILANGKP